MPVRVEVVVARLLDPGQRLDLRQHGRRGAQGRQQRHAALGLVVGDEAAQLGEDALLRDVAGPWSPLARGGGGRGVDREVQLAGQPRGADDAQRVVVEAARGDHPQDAAGDVLCAPVRVDGDTAGQRLGQRVGGEVAQRQVGLQRAAAQRGEIGLPRAVGGQDAPRPELLRQLEQRPARGAGDRARRGVDVAVDDQVDVVDRAAQEAVAGNAADEPGVVPGERAADDRDGLRHAPAAPGRSGRR